MFGRPWTVRGGRDAPTGSDALGLAKHAPATAVGNIAELLDLHQRTGRAADRVASGTVDVPAPIDPAGDQDRCTVKRASPTRPAMATRPRRCSSGGGPLAHHRPGATRRGLWSRGSVLRFDGAGLDMPAGPPHRGRPRRSAARALGQPWSTTTPRQPAAGQSQSGAFRCSTRTSRVARWFAVIAPHHTRKVLDIKVHRLNQPHRPARQHT